MAAENQTVNVPGSQNQIYTAGRDIIFESETEFFEPNLDLFKPPIFPRPKCAAELTHRLQSQRLIVLGDSEEIDAPALCRHLAWLLRENGHSFDSRTERPPVREWARSSKTQQLIISLQKAKAGAIFILPQLTPQDVRYDLGQLQQVASTANHYVIASTESRLSAWRLASERAQTNEKYWCSLSPFDVYGPEQLTDILAQALDESLDELREVIRQHRLNDPAMQSTTAQELKTPENIRGFIRLLCAEKNRVLSGAISISEIVKSSQDRRGTLERWYRLLPPRDQMLALGLSFFDGLFDDQFFVAFEHLVDQVWRRRDQTLQAIDYCDLENLHSFFNFVGSGQHSVNIQGRLPEQRRYLFEAVWNSHRRQLLAALPVIVGLVRASVSPQASDRELFGNYPRRDLLRDVIGETLSDIGLISVDAVETSLLSLAAHGHAGVQIVAARAMARWRMYEKDEALFKMLESWESESRFVRLVKEILSGEDSQNKVEPIDLIRATIAITVGYAACYDPPGEMSGKLVDLFKRFAEDRHWLVRDRFCYLTLPLVIRFHLKQLRDILREMTEQVELIPLIAQSVANAYQFNSGDVEDTIKIWLKSCYQEQNRPRNSTEITWREKLLAMIALVFGSLDLDEKTVFKPLRKMLKDENHPFVRTTVIVAMSQQAEKNFEKTAPELQRLMDLVVKNERDEVVKILTRIYLEQRKNLDGGDNNIQMNNRSYPVWTKEERPETVVERVMRNWLQDPEHPAAQQIATQAFVSFVKAFDQQETVQVEQLRETERQAARQPDRVDLQESSFAPEASTPESPGLRARLALWLTATFRSSQSHEILKGFFPEVLSQRSANRPAMEFVLQRWRKLLDRDLNDALSRSLSLFDALLGLIGLGVVVLGVLGAFFLYTIFA